MSATATGALDMQKQPDFSCYRLSLIPMSTTARGAAAATARACSARAAESTENQAAATTLPRTAVAAP